jgi:hypothetical protein
VACSTDEITHLFDGDQDIRCYGAKHPRGGFLRTQDSRLKLAICAGSFSVHSTIFTFNRTLLPTLATTPVLL